MDRPRTFHKWTSYSVQEDSGREKNHHHGVGILLNKNAAKALIGWKPVNERIITARFVTRHADAMSQHRTARRIGFMNSCKMK